MNEAMNSKKPSSVNATPEVAEFISKLEKGSHLDKIITKAKEKLWENMFAGEPVQKKKIPKYYIRKHGINNLYLMDLDSSRRLTYTLLYNGIGIGIFVLEIFLTHKEYEKRFGYI